MSKRCEEGAASLGFPMLYLYTEVAGGFYSRLGWRLRFVEEYEGENVAVMQKPLRVAKGSD